MECVDAARISEIQEPGCRVLSAISSRPWPRRADAFWRRLLSHLAGTPSMRLDAEGASSWGTFWGSACVPWVSFRTALSAAIRGPTARSASSSATDANHRMVRQHAHSAWTRSHAPRVAIQVNQDGVPSVLGREFDVIDDEHVDLLFFGIEP